MDTARVRAFAGAYLGKGHGPITVSMPSGSENTKAGVRLAADIRTTLNNFGVEWGRITGAQYRAPDNADDSIIFLSFTRYQASASPCGDWSTDYAKSFSNLTPPNFGCATQHNLAAMVADPYELIAPSGVTPADAARRGVVLDNYRQGEITASEQDEQASGIVSDVEGGG